MTSEVATGNRDNVHANLDRFLRHAFSSVDTTMEKVAMARAWTSGRAGGAGFSPTRWNPGTNFEPRGLHYNCATFRPEATGARFDATMRTHVVMLDDVGDMPGKSACPLDRVLALPVPPHAVIVTRRDGKRLNGQAVWFIVPVACEVAQTLVSLAARDFGWGDPNARSPVQWARPPGSIKLDNNFPAELLIDNLDLPRVNIDMLASTLGLPSTWREVSRCRGTTNSRSLPVADDVRAAMRLIVNDFDREGWITVAMALMASCGEAPALDVEEGFQLFDSFSQQHASYNPRDTVRTWRSLRPTRVGFGTLAHLALGRVLEIGSGRFSNDPISPQTPVCIIAPYIALAHAAMKAVETTHALVVPDFDLFLVRIMKLPLAASRIAIVHGGNAQHRNGGNALCARLKKHGLRVEILHAAPSSSFCGGLRHD